MFLCQFFGCFFVFDDFLLILGILCAVSLFVSDISAKKIPARAIFRPTGIFYRQKYIMLRSTRPFMPSTLPLEVYCHIIALSSFASG